MNKRKFPTFILSFVPGVGHYYLGLMQRGLQFNLMFFGLLAVSILSKLDFLNLFIPVVWFYVLFDALRAFDDLQAGEIEDRPVIPWGKLRLRTLHIGWASIILGLLSFLRINLRYCLNLPHFIYGDLLQRSLVSLVLVGFGLYLILSRRKTGTTTGKDEAK